jgi:hypothetical protein
VNADEAVPDAAARAADDTSGDSASVDTAAEDDSTTARASAETAAVSVVDSAESSDPADSAHFARSAALDVAASAPDSAADDGHAKLASSAATDTPSASDVPAESGSAGTREDGDPPAGKRESRAKIVTVVPGVPRYHEASCILIRFMGDDDMQKMSLRDAADAGCTPCRACQPDASTV